MRRSAEERLQRLLVMLPWLMERGEVPLAEVAQRFRMTPDEVAADLELAAMCGLPPFVDELIDLFIDDDVVVVGVPRLFTETVAADGSGGVRPRHRRTSRDAAAGRRCDRAARPRAAEAVGGARRRRRRRGAAAASRGRRAHRRCCRRPSERAERLAVRYWTASRDEVTERTITPRRIVHDRGEWYVVADDQRSGERRTFRVDRFESVEPTGEHDERGRTPRRARPLEWFADGGLPAGRAAVGARRRRGSSSAIPWIASSSSTMARWRRRSRWPANAGWSACCCGWGTRRRCSRRSSGGPAPARSAQRVLARYGE